jgi:hypothetical protein
MGNWIKKALGGNSKGALHRELGVPEGSPIPAAKMKEAANSSNPVERKRAGLAKTLEGLHHGSK